MSINFVWEIVRANLSSDALTSWPFRFTLINSSTTATVLAVFIGLFMGRLQWARALRPIVGFAIDDEGSRFRPDSDLWRVNDQLKSRHLTDGIDYFIRWYAQGAPFPAVKNYSDGMQLAWFTVNALTQIRILDVRVRYVDSLGDVHEKTTPIVQRLPSVTVAAIQNTSAKRAQNP